MKEPKAVIDTNIIVGILKGSAKLSLIYTAFKENKFKLIISPEVLKELSAVLYRPRLNIDSRNIKELFRLIKTRAVRMELSSPFINACRDPKDNFILELAVEAKVDCIVTGDKDLLALNPFQRIPIITAGEFIIRLKR